MQTMGAVHTGCGNGDGNIMEWVGCPFVMAMAIQINAETPFAVDAIQCEWQSIILY